MPRSRIVASTTQRYIDSPLAQIIAVALAKIDELKLKYPLAVKSKKGHTDSETVDSPELIYSLEKIDVVKDFLEKLIALLKPYDNYKKPSVGVSRFSDVDVSKLYVLINDYPPKLITRKAALVEAVKKQLPDLIKQVKKELRKEEKKATSTTQPTLSLNERLRDQLNNCKGELSKQAMKIPGNNFDLLFKEVVDFFLEKDYSGIDDADLGCDLVKILATKGQATPTFDSVNDLFKSQYGVILYGDMLFYVDRINKQIKKIVAPLGEEDSVKSLIELISKMTDGDSRPAVKKELEQVTLVTGSTRNLTDVLDRVDEQLFAKDEKYSFTIAHPMTLEFALFMVDLMDQRPSTLHELLPFFNPQALNVDLHSGSTGTTLSLANAGYTYKSNLDPSTAPTDYQFQLSTYYKGRVVEQMTMNAAESYQKYFSNFFNLLTSQLPHYFHDYADSPVVQSEQARSRLLQQLLINETEWIEGIIHTQQDEPNASKQDGMLQIKAQVAQLDTLEAQLQENTELDKRVSAIHALQQQLTQLASSYETLSVNDLIEKHGTLKAQLALDTANQLDVAYAGEPVPSQVLVVNSESEPNDVATKPIKKSLIETLEHGQAILQQRLDSIAVRQSLISYANKRLLEPDQGNVEEQSSTESDVTEDKQEILFEIIDETLQSNQESLDEQINMEVDLVDNQRSSSELVRSPARLASPQSLTRLIEKVSSWGEILEEERLSSQSKLAEIQQQLSVLKQPIQADMSINVCDFRADIETAITQLKQEALAIYSPYSDSAQDASLEQCECMQFLNSHHEVMVNQHNEMVSTKTARINFVTEQLSGYTQIYEKLTQTKKSAIPFDEINKLPFLTSHPSIQHTGFNLFLVLIGAEIEIADWEEYRKRRGGYFSHFISFKKQSNVDEFSIRLSRLTGALDSKIRDLQETLKTELESESNQAIAELKQHIQKLSEVIREIDAKHQILTQLAEHDHELERQIQYEEVGRHVRELITVIQDVNSTQGKFEEIGQADQAVVDIIPKLVELFTQIKQQHVVIEEQVVKIASYKRDFVLIQEDIQAALENQKTVIQGIVKLGRDCLQNYILALNQQLDAVAFDEQQMTTAANEQKLAEINALLSQQESIELLAKFVECPYPLNFFEQKKTETATKIRAYSKLTQRLQERSFEMRVLQTGLSAELKRCLLEESVKREIIGQLEELLGEYEKSGDSKQAIVFLKATIPQFVGQDVQAILYKSLSTLMDLDCQIPVDYLQPEEEISHETTCQILQASPKKYSAKVNALYKKIEGMTKYGEKLAKGNEQEGQIVKDLAKKLGHLVDHFVVSNQQTTIGQKRDNFQRFKEHFIARAHSEDDLMRRHDYVWTRIVTNLVFGVLTVGLAFGVKLIYSLVAERRVSPLFFDRPQGEEKIANMKNTVDDLVCETSITTLV